MPKIVISKKDLENLIGKELPSGEELEDILMYSKIELDEEDGDNLKIELKDTNRPDMWCVEGVARDLKGKLNIEKGIPKYEIVDTGLEVYIEKTQRPYCACAVVYGVNLGKEGFESLIQYQEKLSTLLGRRRKEVAIGTHNLDLIKFPVYYKNFDLDEIKFKPLYFDQEMSLREILEKHPKGQEYGKLLDLNKKMPVFIDSKNEVISFPPIINSNTIGNINENTKNIFIDVTGYDPYYVDIALNCIVTALAERGGKIGRVKIIDPDGNVRITPDLKVVDTGIELNFDYIRKISGLDLTDKEIVDLLERSRVEVKNNRIYYMNYRRDYMHLRDVVEDVIVSYGVNNIDTKPLMLPTKGEKSEISKIINEYRKFFVGCGATEIRTRILTSSDILENGKVFEYLKLENPISPRFAVFRPCLYPQVLDFLSKNTSREYPQIVFEIGEVIDKEGKTSIKGCFAIASNNSNVGEILSYIKTFCRCFGIEYKVEEKDFDVFVPGRSGNIGGNIIFGEVHPEVLEKFEIEMPVSLFEFKICDLN